MTPGVVPALQLGGVLALLALPAPQRLAAALGMVALALQLVIVVQAPSDPYFAMSLQAWEQGRFIRFHGLAKWVGWLWPLATLVWLGLRVASSERMPPWPGADPCSPSGRSGCLQSRHEQLLPAPHLLLPQPAPQRRGLLRPAWRAGRLRPLQAAGQGRRPGRAGRGARQQGRLSGPLRRRPVAVVYPEAVWYTFVDEADIDEIVRSHLRDGQPVERLMLPPSVGR
jgi:(2Fe-2S) ferredoxin